MGELGLNKIFGALLAVALGIMGLRELSSIVFGGGHYGAHDYASLNEWASETFHGYRINIAESGGSAEVVEVVYDLGALLANADASKGERSYKGKCASCHTVEQGGSSGTGPNLFNTVNGPKGARAGFSYSGALDSTEGDWTYENLDAWLKAPSKYARGTNMAFAGLNRDDERANVLAYLTSFTPDAPAFPAPLPPAEETATEDIVTDSSEILVEGSGELTIIIPDNNAPVIEAADGTIDQVIEDASETPAEMVDEIVEEGTEMIEDGVESPGE
ncbi:MAG: cytochrome c family protein [Henriciella sp.]|nr:cytochrome c family protein [Henriciella sp.]